MLVKLVNISQYLLMVTTRVNSLSPLLLAAIV